jgi:sugar phosphate isomerase/epimerase
MQVLVTKKEKIMNNIIGVTQWSLPGEGQYPFHIAKELGFNALQLDIGNAKKSFALSSSFLQNQYIKDSKDLKIPITSLAVNSLNQFGFTHPSSSKEKKIAYETLEKAINIAKSMSVDSIVLPNFGFNKIENDIDYINTVNALKFICRLAETENIIVYTENILSPSKFMQLLDDVSSSSLKLLFDSQNYHFFDKVDCSTYIEELFPYFGNQVHFKDGCKKMGNMSLGEGATNFNKSAQILKDKSFNGYIILENSYYNNPNLASKDIKKIKEIF